MILGNIIGMQNFLSQFFLTRSTLIITFVNLIFEIKKKKILSYFHTKFPLLNNDRISCEEFYCLQKIEEKYDKMLEYKKETHFCDLSVKKKKDKIKKWVRDERNQVTKNCMHIDRVDNNEQFNDWVSRMIKSMCRRD